MSKGKDKDEDRKAGEREIERKAEQAMWSFFGSAKEESDRRAARGEGWELPRD